MEKNLMISYKLKRITSIKYLDIIGQNNHHHIL